MQKNLFVVLAVSSLTSFAWSAHLMTPGSCFPCIFAANHLPNRVDKTLDSFLTLATSSDVSNRIAASYLLDLESLRSRAKEAAAVATARQLVRCRHARSTDARGDGSTTKTKLRRRMASSDLALCHFKICNMGRKRSVRFVNTINDLQDD